MENDLISRSALEIAVRELADKHHALGQIEFANGVIKTITRIHAAPTIAAVPVVHGRWIDTGDYVTTAYGSLDIRKCSICGADVTIDDHDSYCPSCGARMDGEETPHEH